MKRPTTSQPRRVALIVEGTSYVPVRALELDRLRNVEKAARELIDRTRVQRGVTPASALRKLALAVRT